MIKQIVSAIIKFWKWIHPHSKEIPVIKLIPDRPVPVKGARVFSEYLVVEYCGQKISLHKTQVPIWNKMPRKDKRIMADKFKKQIQNGKIRFELINGKWLCLKNKDYNPKINGIQKNC